ncbi:LOW QUALITY PROTEIN: hypothetical protein CVT25_002095 [Psilocybe cyanescens]|uniref:Uncharacterized protein n=1 Tax=Psilocybe cyanescens TaxID=93625 RepID=A0A409X9C5_PSICY|nr:LOW QUALITY PROTEIN: hypothetical protein CVT25_002095 [Psilocybe cyanescens]
MYRNEHISRFYAAVIGDFSTISYSPLAPLTPNITTIEDVSQYAVDIRDDRDDALTFRSMFLGTLFAGIGAALCQSSNPMITGQSPNIAILYRSTHSNIKIWAGWRDASSYSLPLGDDILGGG